MGRLLDWLLSSQGFFFLIIFGGWIVSTIGGAMQKVAKKAAEQQARQKTAPQAKPRPAHVPGQMQRMPSSKGQMARAKPPEVEVPSRPAVVPVPRGDLVSRGPSEEDIAKEIRRLMGMEPVAQPEPKPEPKPESIPVKHDPVVPAPSMIRRHASSGQLAEEMARRDKEVQHLGVLQDRHQPMGSGVSERRLDTVLTRRFDQEAAANAKAKAARRRNLGHVLDLRRPATAFLAGEVFGQPRGLKGWDS